jgi:hypothetical protein
MGIVQKPSDSDRHWSSTSVQWWVQDRGEFCSCTVGLTATTTITLNGFHSTFCVDLMSVEIVLLAEHPSADHTRQITARGHASCPTALCAPPSTHCHHVWSHEPLLKPRSKVRSLNRRGRTTKTLGREDACLARWRCCTTTPHSVPHGLQFVYIVGGQSLCPVVLWLATTARSHTECGRLHSFMYRYWNYEPTMGYSECLALRINICYFQTLCSCVTGFYITTGS